MMTYALGKALVVVRLADRPLVAERHGSLDLLDDAGGEDDTNARPVFTDPCGEAEAVHGARHLDIGEEQIDNLIGFKGSNRFGRIARLDDMPATAAQIACDVDANRKVVLDDEDGLWLV